MKLAMDTGASKRNGTWEVEELMHSADFHQTLNDHGYVKIQIECNK
jgi:hypothetical protein